MPGEVYGELIEQQIPGEYASKDKFSIFKTLPLVKTIDGLILLPIKTAITK